MSCVSYKTVIAYKYDNWAGNSFNSYSHANLKGRKVSKKVFVFLIQASRYKIFSASSETVYLLLHYFSIFNTWQLTPNNIFCNEIFDTKVLELCLFTYFLPWCRLLYLSYILGMNITLSFWLWRRSGGGWVNEKNVICKV